MQYLVAKFSSSDGNCRLLCNFVSITHATKLILSIKMGHRYRPYNLNFTLKVEFNRVCLFLNFRTAAPLNFSICIAFTVFIAMMYHINTLKGSLMYHKYIKKNIELNINYFYSFNALFFSHLLKI